MNQVDSVAYIGGCGRLGLSLAAWSAECGIDVVVADINGGAVNMVASGKCPISEPGVAPLIEKHFGGKLLATTDTKHASLHSDIICIIVPTPSDYRSGSFSLEYILDACKEIGAALAETDDYKVVIVCSTVNPGDTRGEIREALERHSGKKVGLNFGLCYSPEFIRQGEIVRDFANPHQLLIGEYDGKSGWVAERYYERIVKNDAPIHKMSLESAEVAKIGLNSAIVAKIAVANQLMWVSHYTPFADSRDVLKAIGSDPRIGSSYFGGGLPAGGPCFPRDSRALYTAIEKIDVAHVPSLMAHAAHQSIKHEISSVVNIILAHEGRIGILGLAYKSGIDIVEGSVSVMIANMLKHGFHRNVLVYDDNVYVDGLTAAGSIEQLVELTDVIVIAVPDPKFFGLYDVDASDKVVIDCWGDLQGVECKEYIRIGRGAE
jgi:UDPglucose 6-dehydrogenase